MADVIPTTFTAILNAFIAQILAHTNLTSSQVFISQEDDPPEIMGGPIVILTAGNERPIIPIPSGGGRVDPRVRRLLTIRLRTRMALDEVDRSAIWLQHASLGHLQYEDQIINACMIEFLQDSSENLLTWEPLKLLGVTTPNKPGRTSGGTDWGRSDLHFDVAYIRDLQVSNFPYPLSDFAIQIVNGSGVDLVDESGNLIVTVSYL